MGQVGLKIAVYGCTMNYTGPKVGGAAPPTCLKVGGLAPLVPTLSHHCYGNWIDLVHHNNIAAIIVKFALHVKFQNVYSRVAT